MILVKENKGIKFYFEFNVIIMYFFFVYILMGDKIIGGFLILEILNLYVEMMINYVVVFFCYSRYFFKVCFWFFDV